jgi:hypothetical protein
MKVSEFWPQVREHLDTRVALATMAGITGFELHIALRVEAPVVILRPCPGVYLNLRDLRRLLEPLGEFEILVASRLHRDLNSWLSIEPRNGAELAAGLECKLLRVGLHEVLVVREKLDEVFEITTISGCPKRKPGSVSDRLRRAVVVDRQNLLKEGRRAGDRGIAS